MLLGVRVIREGPGEASLRLLWGKGVPGRGNRVQKPWGWSSCLNAPPAHPQPLEGHALVGGVDRR